MKVFASLSNLPAWQKIYVGLVLLGGVFLALYFLGALKIPNARVYDCSQVKNFVVLDVTIGEQLEPKNITAYVCDRIRFTAADDTGHWPAVGPHPSHSSYPGFDSNHDLKIGESFEFVLNRPGTYSFHDHSHPNLIGKITINNEPRSLKPPARP